MLKRYRSIDRFHEGHLLLSRKPEREDRVLKIKGGEKREREERKRKDREEDRHERRRLL